MKFAEGLILFETLAVKRGFSPTLEREIEVIAVWTEDACLRLRSVAGGVCLEVTHGPPNGPQGWLDLYEDPNNPELPSLADCILYGLDFFDVRES